MSKVSMLEQQDVSTSLTDSNVLFSCCVSGKLFSYCDWGMISYSLLKPNGTTQRVHVTWICNIW